MRKLSLIILTAAALLLLVAGPAYGQRVIVKGEIPFDFSVGNKTLPADTYMVKKASAPSDVLFVRGNGNGALSIAQPMEDVRNGEPNGRLVFRKYGDEYFLAEVWSGVNNTGFELPKSSKERQVSLNRPEPELIYIAAK